MSYGRFWYCSATGAVESAYHIKHGVGIEFSEQQLIDCSTNSSGCIAGHPYVAFDYIKSKGINNATEYPYLGVQGLCRSNSDSVVNVTGYVLVTAVSILYGFWFSPTCKTYIQVLCNDDWYYYNNSLMNLN